MAKRVTRSEPAAAEQFTLRVTSPFIHRGVRVFVGEIIQCTKAEAEGLMFTGWATPHGLDGADAGAHERRDMRAKQ